MKFFFDELQDCIYRLLLACIHLNIRKRIQRFDDISKTF